MAVHPDYYMQFRSPEERDNDQHFEDFRETGNPDCNCTRCQYWREQERQDLENV